MSVYPIRRPEMLGETEIREFDYAFFVHQEIVRLQIPMKYPVVVEVFQPEASLQDVRLDVGRCEDDGGVFDDDLHVRVHKVHDEGDVGLYAAKDVPQRYDVGVADLAE